jgi:DDE superfamily endonuclease
VAGFPLRRPAVGVLKDESGFHTSMARLKARAPRGERAYGEVPRNRGKNQTLIASITLEGGMGAALSIEGSTDAELFEAYVEEFLTPTLKTGQVVVLDGLWGRTGAGGSGSSSNPQGRRPSVPAELLGGPQPDRGSVLQDKEHRQEGRSAHPRDAR